MYLVPAEREEQGDLFVEWVYVNNSWEKFGSTAINITIPDWEAVEGEDGYIRNKPDLKVGTGNDSITNRHSVASGAKAFAIGNNNNASGENGFATGANNTVRGVNAFVNGSNAAASGAHSHSEGYGTIANHRSQHVYGEFNNADASAAASTARGNYVEIVGNGTAENARSNARTLDWSGNEWIKGNLKIGGNSYDDPNAKELATKEYVDEHAGTGSVTDVKINGTSIVDGETGEAEIPIAVNRGTAGIVKINQSLGITEALGVLTLSEPTVNTIKPGANGYYAISPKHQHESTFYGLAKAAGHDESNSTLPVGTYTEEAKSAISEMLGGAVSVTGTTPNINAKAGIRYVCGEVSTLDITLPASGIVDVLFTSGSTPTVLTITPPTGQTVKWANGFDPTSLDTDTTYEINIMDGLGVAVGWT